MSNTPEDIDKRTKEEIEKEEIEKEVNKEIDKEAKDGKEEVRLAYVAWSTKLTEHSIQLAYAVIGANWAAYSPVSSIAKNSWASLSLATAVLFLAINLVSNWCLSNRCKKRFDYAETHHAQWLQQARDSKGKGDNWPYTDTIDSIGTVMRFLKVAMPAAAAVLFSISLTISPSESVELPTANAVTENTPAAAPLLQIESTTNLPAADPLEAEAEKVEVSADPSKEQGATTSGPTDAVDP